MKKTGWFCLSLILSGMAWSDISWGRDHRHGHGYFAGKQNFSFGVGYRTGSFGHYNRFGHRGRTVGFYGSFGYGRPFPYYGRPFYRPRHYGYFSSRFYGPAYYPPLYSPVVVVPTPPVYIQQPQPVQPAPPAASVITTTHYWHYCEDPAGYYPEVESCPGGWIQVPPRPAQ